MKITREERARRNALSNDEAMADALSMCLPCKLCGGKAVIEDAGTGWGYYITCENASDWRPKCMLAQPRRSGWAYNCMELWNGLMAPPPAETADTTAEDEKPCPVCGNEERGQGGYLSCECPSPLKNVVGGDE